MDFSGFIYVFNKNQGLFKAWNFIFFKCKDFSRFQGPVGTMSLRTNLYIPYNKYGHCFVLAGNLIIISSILGLEEYIIYAMRAQNVLIVMYQTVLFSLHFIDNMPCTVIKQPWSLKG